MYYFCIQKVKTKLFTFALKVKDVFYIVYVLIRIKNFYLNKYLVRTLFLFKNPKIDYL